MPVSEQTYLRVAEEDPEGKWELICGKLIRKPGMTSEHEDIAAYLGASLIAQLPRDQFRVRIEGSRVRRSERSYFVADVTVAPTSLVLPQRGTGETEVFRDPLPLVVEVWSPSTGDYDVRTKLPEYRARGDLEIWLIHPFDRTLTAWRRQPDGSYTETVAHGGTIQPVALPNVAIDLDALFE